MNKIRLLAMVVLAALMAACFSPEATRQPGQPGADVGNRDGIVRFHGGAEPYYAVACAASLKPCTGPMPVFGQGAAR